MSFKSSNFSATREKFELLVGLLAVALRMMQCRAAQSEKPTSSGPTPSYWKGTARRHGGRLSTTCRFCQLRAR